MLPLSLCICSLNCGMKRIFWKSVQGTGISPVSVSDGASVIPVSSLALNSAQPSDEKASPFLTSRFHRLK